MLEVKNICYSIKENGETKHILKDVSFSVGDGETVVLTGPNGSGKSTLAKIIMGIVKQTSGKIIYNGVDISNMPIDKRANLGFAYAYQQPVTFKGLTVKDLIDLACKKENTVSQSCEYLSKVGLCAKEYVNREVNGKLSGGELKRIELAELLAKNADLNICDEPEAGIDLWSFDALINIFSTDKSFLVISHQKRLIERANKVILLSNGKIDKIGSYEKIKDSLTPMTCAQLGGENE